MIYQGLLGLVYFNNEDKTKQGSLGYVTFYLQDKTKQGSLGDIYLYRIVGDNDCP
jgi:hypothetical protein